MNNIILPFRFLGSACIGFVTLLLTGEVKLKEIPTMVKTVFVPAILLWLANYMNSISLQLAGWHNFVFELYPNCFVRYY